jgi:hypothetical protein
MKKYIITLNRRKNHQAETCQVVISGSLADIMDQLINFTSGFEISSTSTRWEVINVKEA